MPNNVRGSTLVLLIMAIIMISILATSYYHFQSVSYKNTGNYARTDKILFPAESGKNIAEYKLYNDTALLQAIAQNSNSVYNPFASLGDTVGAAGPGTKIIDGCTVTVSIKRIR